MSKFYICKICGNLVEKVEDGGLAPMCCGKKMTILNSEEATGSSDRHLPIITTHELTCPPSSAVKFTIVNVKVSSDLHPSLNNHYIKWIQLETNHGAYRHYFKYEEIPNTNFIISKDEIIRAAYAYCNIHGLWMNTKKST